MNLETLPASTAVVPNSNDYFKSVRVILLTQKNLSDREAEVAWWVAHGLRNRAVGEKLFVAEKTVKFHLTSIYKKMEVGSRIQLTQEIIRICLRTELMAKFIGHKIPPEIREQVFANVEELLWEFMAHRAL